MSKKLTIRQTMGISIWWAEGSKSRRDKRWKTARTYPIEVTNTDPRIINLFLLFLRKDLKVDEQKIRVQLQIHKGDNEKDLEKYWSKVTKIPKSRFQKTIIRPVGNKIGKSRGTCKVRFSNKSLYLKLEDMLAEALSKI